MCHVSIPFFSNSEDGKALQRCIDRASEQSSVDAYSLIVAMTHFWEAAAAEVASGHAVNIPGFGRFAPIPIPERHRMMSRDMTPRCKPSFSASRGFKQEVAFGAPPNDSETVRQRQHQKNHAAAGRNDSARVFTAMQAMRDQLAAQVGRSRN